MAPLFLVCEPRHYAVDYDINPWMSSSIGQVDTPRAHRQWEELMALLQEFGAELQVMRSQPAGLPDLVFTANAALVRNQVAYLAWFAKAERQPEHAYYGAALRAAGLSVDTRFVHEALPFEGAGDALFFDDGKALAVGYGFRSTQEGAVWLARAIATTQVFTLRLRNARFYHLDTCFCPLSDGSILWYPGAFGVNAVADIAERIGAEKLLAVTAEEAADFVCNAVEVNGCLIAHRWSRRLRHLLGARGYATVACDLSEYLKAGGSAKCLTLRLR